MCSAQVQPNENLGWAFGGHNCIANSIWYFVKQTLFFGHQVRIVPQSRYLSLLLKAKIPRKSEIYKGFMVPRPGVEPGWIAPLVFETSASTDSAIWA